ncbi:MAG TPA: T9SS type A sorting domain-containing protein [Chitinophagales bacterium]|nr:T9SS type A sorting domain-containing protein [Chitinophagales bacterium]
MKKRFTLLVFIICLANESCAQNGIITTVAGNGIAGFSGDGGIATSAELYNAIAVGFDGAGNMYIAEPGNQRIRKVDTLGIITTIAGNGIGGFSGDGGAATAAELNYPQGIGVDFAGNVYFADALNHRIRKISTAGIITTVAGTGVQGYTGDGSLATLAEINTPNDVTVDTAGNIFISDEDNEVIRKVDTAGIITTIAGNGIPGYNGDGGQAINAQLNSPKRITVDPAGNLYIADAANSRIRKVAINGIITTIAGNGTAGNNSDGGLATAAELTYPAEIVLDVLGDLYIDDQNANTIRKVNTAGIITTIAGNGTAGYSGDGGTATAAELYYPTGIALDASGNIYIADWNNNRVRKVNNTITNFSGIETSLCEKLCTGFLDQSTDNPTSWLWIFPGGAPSSSTDQNPAGICYNAPGTYDVTLITTNAFGNDTLTLTNYITVYPTPPPPTITQNGNVLTSSAAVSYQWQLNSVDIPGATMQNYTYTQPGLYTVYAGDSNGCANYASLLITAVENVANEFPVSVSPNPSNGNFTIELINCSAQHISLRILNTLGEEIVMQNFTYLQNDYKKEVDLHYIAAGVYFIEMKTENEFIRKKIIVAR